jgi:DNA-binding transcriptional MerR regulator
VTPAKGGEPVREFFSIGDVCAMTGLKAHVLRYWESQFKFLSPSKNRSGNRVYTRREVEFVQLVKHLLYTEKYTIEGARQKIEEHRRGGGVRPAARLGLEVETVQQLESDLTDLLTLLEDEGTD